MCNMRLSSTNGKECSFFQALKLREEDLMFWNLFQLQKTKISWNVNFDTEQESCKGEDCKASVPIHSHCRARGDEALLAPECD